MYVVTGGGGFIGSHIVAALAARGENVIVVDHFGSTDKWKNIAKSEVADLVPPDRLFPTLDTLGAEVRAVVHMGAISATTETDVDLIIANNFRLSMDLWNWCAANHTPFVYASSAATYGDGMQGFDDDPKRLASLRPLNPYGWSKHTFDRRVMRLLTAGALKPPQWAGLKFFNVYGPNEYHKGSMMSVVAKSFPRAVAGDAVTLFKSHHPDFPDGGQRRDFIYVKDCVRVILWLLDNPRVSGLFNVGTGEARSFAELINALFVAVERPAKIDFVETPIEIRDKYQYFTEARMGRLRDAGFGESFHTLEEGVADYVREYLKADDPYVGPEDYAD